MSGRRALYPRLLRLRHVHPNGWQRAVLGEGALVAAAVLVLADLATAWTLLVLPLTVAAVVKGHDLLAGSLAHPVGGSTAGRPDVRADVEQGDAASGPRTDGDRHAVHPDGDRDAALHPDGDRDAALHPDGDRDAEAYPDSDPDPVAPPVGDRTPPRPRTATGTATRRRRARPGRPSAAAAPPDGPGAARSSRPR